MEKQSNMSCITEQHVSIKEYDSRHVDMRARQALQALLFAFSTSTSIVFEYDS